MPDALSEAVIVLIVLIVVIAVACLGRGGPDVLGPDAVSRPGDVRENDARPATLSP